MITLASKKECSGCSACAAVCPKNCINMTEDGEGFLYPTIDHDRCVQCGKCRRACQALVKAPPGMAVRTFAARLCAEEPRSKSSSGGMFYLLAKKVISSGGVVFGAAFQEDFELKHTFADCETAITPLCGSKYLQSRISDAFRMTDSFLREGRKVLFVGTPCQVVGLKNFLDREDDNLICADIVCHGVPSRNAWRSYIEELENVAGAKMTGINFRDKTDGWRSYRVTSRFSNGAVYSSKASQDPFMRGYLAHLYLRPSCHHCYKSSSADLTLGDCWGAETLAPGLDDDRGTSLVIIRSEKGAQLFEAVAAELDRQEISYNDAIEFNPSVCFPTRGNPKRKEYFKSQAGFSQTVEKLSKATFIQRWEGRLRALKRNIKLQRKK